MGARLEWENRGGGEESGAGEGRRDEELETWLETHCHLVSAQKSTGAVRRGERAQKPKSGC